MLPKRCSYYRNFFSCSQYSSGRPRSMCEPMMSPSSSSSATPPPPPPFCSEDHPHPAARGCTATGVQSRLQRPTTLFKDSSAPIIPPSPLVISSPSSASVAGLPTDYNRSNNDRGIHQQPTRGSSCFFSPMSEVPSRYSKTTIHNVDLVPNYTTSAGRFPRSPPPLEDGTTPYPNWEPPPAF